MDKNIINKLKEKAKMLRGKIDKWHAPSNDLIEVENFYYILGMQVAYNDLLDIIEEYYGKEEK